MVALQLHSGYAVLLRMEQFPLEHGGVATQEALRGSRLNMTSYEESRSSRLNMVALQRQC